MPIARTAECPCPACSIMPLPAGTTPFAIRWSKPTGLAVPGFTFVQSSRDGAPGMKSGTSGGFLLRGLVAGAIGAWVMDRTTWMLQDRQNRQAIRREREAWPEGLDVSHGLGHKIAGAAGLPASKSQPGTLGMTTHYCLSIGPAILYAALRERDL